MWKIRRYKKGDEDEILSLLRLVLKKPYFNKRYWKWMFLDNPAGRASIWVAEDKGSIIAHYALIPVRVCVGDTEAIYAEAINIAVHPMYQGKGIFPFLVRKAKSHAKIVYSFPNKKSLPIFIHKLGWKQKETLDQLLYIIDAAKLARRKGKHFFLMKLITKKPHISSNSSILLRKITTFDKKTTSLWKKISKSDIITVRDQAYLSWRFIKNPTANYTIYRAEKNNEITGYIVLKTNGITGTVIDILSIDNETLDALIAKSVDHFNN